MLIVWERAEAAAAGAGVIGPGLFARLIVPYLASEQQRSGDEVVAQHPR